jgi:hypothetical protein
MNNKQAKKWSLIYKKEFKKKSDISIKQGKYKTSVLKAANITDGLTFLQPKHKVRNCNRIKEKNITKILQIKDKFISIKLDVIHNIHPKNEPSADY